MKRMLRILLILILCMSISMDVYATSSSDLRRQKKEKQQEAEQTQQQLKDKNSQISGLTDAKEDIDEEIELLDSQIVEVMASISLIEDDIKETQEKIVIAKADLEEAIRIENEQYEAMKARVKFMYEKGESSYVQLLVESKSTAEFVNKADYIDRLYTYDRSKLEEYISAKEAVEEAKAHLEEEEEELETSKYELELEKGELDTLLEEKKEEAEDYENQIAKAKQEAAAFKAKIKQQNNEIRKLEEAAKKKEAEEAAAAAAAAAEEARKRGETPDSDSSSSSSKKTGSAYNVDSQTVISNSGGSAKGKEIANYACQFVGNPYVAGGTSLTNGCDCSGFTMSVFQACGYSIPRSSTAQRSCGVGVDYADAQPGDIICYAGHVALYIGNGQIVHASTPSTGIKYGSATYKQILAVRRVAN